MRNIKYKQIIEYMVSDDTEIFVLMDKLTGEKKLLGKNEFLSIFLTILNLNEEELTNLKCYIKYLKCITPKPDITPTYIKERQPKLPPYTSEIITIRKAKKYIDNAISTPFYAKYENFKLACELNYFRDISSQQFHDLSSLNIKENDTTTIDFEELNNIFKVNKNKLDFFTAYELRNLEDFIVASMMELFKNKKRIKKCLNCNKYFIAGRSDTSYCNNPSPQNEKKTCSKFIADEKYQNNLAENDTQSLYRKIYKRLNRDMQRNNYGLFIKKFKDFTNEAKAKKQKIKNGEITEEEYFKWLKDEDIKKELLND